MTQLVRKQDFIFNIELKSGQTGNNLMIHFSVQVNGSK